MIDRRAFLAGTTAAATVFPALPAAADTALKPEPQAPAAVIPAPPSIMDELDATLNTMKSQIEKAQLFTGFVRKVEQEPASDENREKFLSMALSQIGCFSGPLVGEAQYQNHVVHRLMEQICEPVRKRKEQADARTNDQACHAAKRT